MIRTTATLGAVVCLVLSVAPQPSSAGAADAPAAGRPASPASPANPAARAASALARLNADAGGSVRVSRGQDGWARVVRVTGAHNPAVTRTMSVRDAARAQLTSYGGLVGLAEPGTRLAGGQVTRTVTGDHVVRFSQLRNGLPVIGGGVAVDLRPDRQLDSVTSAVSRATVPPATYSSSDARSEALAAAVKRWHGHHVTPTAEQPVHELYDPAALGVRHTSDPLTRARGVWSVEVHAGPAFRRQVLIDDRSGAVVLDLDSVEHVNRVVCDNHDFNTFTDVPCTSDFARVEHGPASTVKDVNDAFVLAGVVARFYRDIGGLDLTRMLGVDEGGHKSLSSTVRYCDPGARPADCPLKNAFWNGVGMFYGDGFASADDVVGHEMTHGVISHYADLFYWGQSGAINESLADIMGEIIDHRHHTDGERADNWQLGEDLPGGAVRNMKRPGRYGQPDSMTSRAYFGGLDDNGGVHVNSGVGNRTFYLISQGGRQGGQTVRGIDGKSLRTSAVLYLDVIQHLVSGSDYADLASVLDHSCHALARHHDAGMTKADCRNVHRATLATRLRTVPPQAKQPPDARMSCPRGAGPVRVLFDSEKGTATSKFDAGSTWLRAPDPSVFPAVPANATSRPGSWFSFDPDSFTVSSLVMHPVALPVGRAAYLWFQQWRLLDFGPSTHTYYDGGTVEVADTTRGSGAKPAEHRTWVNGPRDVITDQFDNPAAGRVSFGGDSRGYLASRLALGRFAGHAVSPQFTMNTDDSVADQGWYLDDVRVYTCGRGPMPRRTPTVSGTPAVGETLTAHPGVWTSQARLRVQWYAGRTRLATGTSYVLRAGDLGKRLTARVTATAGGRHTSTTSPATPVVTG